MEHIELKKAVEIYLKTLDEKSKSYNQKRNGLTKFVAFLEQELERPPLTSDFSYSACRDFLNSEKSKYKPSTINARVASLRTFGSAWAKHFNVNDFTGRISFEEVEDGDAKHLTEKERFEVLNIAGQISTDPFKRFRDKFIVELLDETGLRADEVLNIRYGDVNLESKNRSIRVTCKRDIRRVCPISYNCYHKLDLYLAGREQFLIHLFKLEGKDYLSLSSFDKNFIPLIINTHLKIDELRTYRLRYENLRRLFQRISARVGYKVTAHMFRHTLAYRLVEDGVSIRVIAQILGHRDIKTTMKYTKSKTSKLIETLDALSKKNVVQ